MRRSVLLLAALAIAVLLASGVALAVTPTGTPHSGVQEKGPDAALDGALRSLVARHGGPPGVIAIVQRGRHREVHTFGCATGERAANAPGDRMSIARTARLLRRVGSRWWQGQLSWTTPSASADGLTAAGRR